jgi:hypothetical protein
MTIASMVIAVGSMTNYTSAETVEVAKKCQALTAKMYPPREVGNPAAGSAQGTSQQEREYFSKCVANDGNVDQSAPPDDKGKK